MTHPNTYKIVPFGRNGKMGEIMCYDLLRALEIGRAMETASEVRTIQIYMNNFKLHEWKRK